MKFVLLGDPVSQCRPRLGKGIVYDPNHAYKQKCRWIINNQMIENRFKPRSNQPIGVRMTFYTPMTKYELKTQKKRNFENAWDLSKKDVDNLCKLYLDCMTKIVYPDDHFVVQLSAKKVKSYTPRVIIHVLAKNNNLLCPKYNIQRWIAKIKHVVNKRTRTRNAK